MSKYRDGLLASDKDKEAAQADSQEAQAATSVDQFIASLTGQLSKAQQTALNLKTQFPLDVQAVINANANIAEIQASLATASALKTELF